MTKFTQRRFSVSAPMTDAYREGWEKCFGRKNDDDENSATASASTPAQVGTGTHQPRAHDVRDDSTGDLRGPQHHHPTQTRRPVEISRDELAKWQANLEQVGGNLDEVPVAKGAGRQALRQVIESMKLVLQAHDKGNTP